MSERPAPPHSEPPTPVHQTTQCRSCHAAIIWGISAAGKDIPVDAEPVQDGNLQLTPATGILGNKPIVMAVSVARRARYSKLYVAHFATCPEADKWRRRAPTTRSRTA